MNRRRKRILLINPPDTRSGDMQNDKVRIGLVAPLGIAYMAAVFEKQDYEVNILDCVAQGQFKGLSHHGGVRYGMTDEGIVKVLLEEEPDIVGVSCLFSNKSFDAHNVCKLVKEVNQNILTLIVGTPEFTPDDVALLKDKANRDINFVHNINLREGKYEKAIEDFQDVVKLYPNLQYAKNVLLQAKNSLNIRYMNQHISKVLS